MTTPADSPSSVRSTKELTAFAFIAALVLLWAELFLTANAEEPNTWSGVVTDTLILLIAGAVALALAAASARDGRADAFGIAAFVAALVFALPFWTGAVIVVGATAYLLNRRERPVLAWIAAGLAALVALFLLVSVIIDFAPGLPA